MKLKLNKWFFSRDLIHYIFYFIQPGIMAISKKATDTIQQLHLTMKGPQMKLFLGPWNFFLFVTPYFVSNAGLLSFKLENDKLFQIDWLKKMESRESETLKQRQLSSPIQALPRRDRRYKLSTEAFKKPFEGHFLQKPPKRPGNPVVYCSCSLMRADQTLMPRRWCLSSFEQSR